MHFSGVRKPNVVGQKLKGAPPSHYPPDLAVHAHSNLD